MAGKVLIYGGRGALGLRCIKHLKELNFWVCSVDLKDNPAADYSIVIADSSDMSTQKRDIVNQLSSKIPDDKFDAIICVAGGWAGGNASNKGMMGYGMAKAAVHQLTKSLAAKGSGLPKDAHVAAILPITLDTPMNRKWMPDADQSSWTPLETVANLFSNWIEGKERPASGSLVKLITKNGVTEFVSV